MNTISLITISFFLFFAFSAKFQLAFSRSSEFVLDREGKLVLPGAEYYVLPPVSSSGGGGLTFQKTGNSTTSTSVLQLNSEGSLGQLVRFNISAGPIFTGSILDIEFVEKPDTVTSSKWTVVYENDNKTTAFVGVGNAEDYPAVKNGIFQIEKLNKNYKFVFCNNTFSINCTDIGKYNDDKIIGAHPLKLLQSNPIEVTFLRGTPSRV
ncbi:hypothetical protein Lal_00034950 [Lupinus albus]|uniref:Uncharacterized protein n=1 Tax=Lupinus albus TaxID=3870 RepID=A0A6A4QUQ4_LUPAL|nr:putative proteinase inhibitor I3, Kunitz legume [Lupinus albus]KAF1897247.1 hypothetical protein Lal_00034950 [Lupinus albus]